MIKKITTISIAAVAFVLSFGGVALAQGAVISDNSSLGDILKPIYDAFTGGERVYAGALALMASLILLKRYAPAKLSTWLKTDVGGSLMAIGVSFSGALAAALAGGKTPFSLGLVWTAGGIAVAAAGGYTLIKKLLIVPIIEPLIPKLPSWMQPIATLVVSFFDGGGEAIIAAQKAGDAAVAANPAPGVPAITGTPTDVK